ncbi:MAG: alpha-L-fucosidase [Candidatus Methylacidiphilales bacterium]|nr:alpha-L-fucosidase [Candidatus Methylacidiphilales bacterium]
MKKTPLLVPKPESRIARFEKLAYGMFIHWGLYSQLGEGEWVMLHQRIPASKYNRLQKTFTAKEFDARRWARLAREAGMRYMTLTTRHHEGFSLYDTRGLSTFDAPHSPARRDLVLEFVEACRAEKLVPFLYHTTIDWQWWAKSSWKPEPDGGADFPRYLDYLHASVEILCRHYGEIGGFWFDGNWAYKAADWKEDRLYALIRKHQPQALIINNTGIGAEGALGHPEIDSTTFEQGLPTMPDRSGWKKYIAGEMCQTMNAHWGIGSRDLNYLSPAQIIETLCLSRKVGANYLLNVGPTAQGGVPEYEAAALRRVGDWLKLFGSSVREGKPVPGVQCQGKDFLLRAGKDFYYFAFNLPIKGNEHVTVGGGSGGLRAIRGLNQKIVAARWLDSDESLSWTQDVGKGLCAVDCTGYPYGTQLVVRVAQLRTG